MFVNGAAEVLQAVKRVRWVRAQLRGSVSSETALKSKMWGLVPCGPFVNNRDQLDGRVLLRGAV